MQLILGISQDNYIAKSESDNLHWLQSDKNVFRLLSATNQGINLISKKSAQFMPKVLPGRTIKELSREGLSLEEAFICYPDANLLGGQILAEIAIRKGFVSDCFIIVNPIEIKEGIYFTLGKIIEEKFKKVQTIKIENLIIQHWKNDL